MPRAKAAQPSRDGLPTSASTTAASPPTPSTTLRKRPAPIRESTGREKMADDASSAHADSAEEGGVPASASGSWTSRNQWVVFAVASGACAAVNGCFAKLTTNELTSTISQALAKAFGLMAIETAIELVVRCIFFGLNLVFNGIMWTLFTKALARGSSTTQVSIMNTSSNFMITAILGFVIFSESLPPLWWAGAAMLVAGNVIIGRKDEDSSSSSSDDGDDAALLAGSGESIIASYTDIPAPEVVVPFEKDDEDEDYAVLGELDEHDEI